LKNHLQTHKWFYNYLSFEAIKKGKKKGGERQKKKNKLTRLYNQKSFDKKVMKY